MVFSDHSLIYGSVNLEVEVEFGRGTWKLNLLLLEDEEVGGRFVSFFRFLDDVRNVARSLES